MAHGRAYIPLTMLTTTALTRIRNNTGLKYTKVPNGIVRQTLDPDQFGSEDAMSSDDWTQAYRNWLALIDVIAEPSIGAGWHAHYEKMRADPQFARWFPAWREHDKQLRSSFTCKFFLIDPQSSSYAQAFQRTRMDQMHDSNAAFLANLSNRDLSPPPASSSAFPPSSFRPPRDPSKILCVRCGTVGHTASDCTATASSRPERPIISEWKNKRLCTMAGKDLCIWFNIKGTCSDSRPTHSAHSCSLCGDAGHGAARCTRN
ncbi:hypothetical protein JB92DRAFT_2723726 [Gautieria morchelliformis]|nr:hypothetical protein JB92DRAFT_2723726 [Gautieria morchelliformis]